MEVKSPEDTKFCSNCRRDIAASNYLMHTMHCQRNLVLCKRCNEPVPRNELDQHMQELHSQVPCGKCSAIVECCELEEHLHSYCPKRTVKCSFCDLECIWDDMKNHESYCGSRTEICNFCGQYVMIKEKEEHDLGNCAKVVAKKQSENNRTDSMNNMKTKGKRGSSYKIPEGAINNTAIQPEVWNYQQSGTLGESADEHRNSSDVSHSTLDEQLAFDLAREDLENLEARHYGELWDNEFDDETVLPFHRTIVPTMLGTRPVIPGYNSDEFIIPVVDQIPEIQADDETTKVESDVELPCEFCGELFPSEVLIQHQSGCNPEMAHGTTVDGVSNNNSALSKTHSSKREKKHEDTDTIPCEFCDQCFPSDYLIEHESQCRPDIAHGPPPWIKKDKQVTNKAQVVSNYADNANIPCEFCGEQFPHHLVIDHQATCDANSLEPIFSDELYPSVNETAVERKQRTLKHQEDPKLEEIASFTTSDAFRKDRNILPLTNKKPIQIELRKSPSKELDSVNETSPSPHNYSQSKTLYDSKRKNIASNFPNIDSYFERSEKNYHRLQKDKSLEDILRRVPEYRNVHDIHPQCHTPFRERDNPFYSDKLYQRHEWSSSQAGARPKSCSDTGIQDGFHHQVSLSRDPYNIDTQTKPKLGNRLAATFLPLSENLSRGMRDMRPSEYSTGHLHFQPSEHESESDIGGKPKSMKRKGMDLHRR